MNLFSKSILVLALATAGACSKPEPDFSTPQFDAAHSIALEGVIRAGRVITLSDNQARVEAAIKEQLWYTVGELNGIGGVVDMRRNLISVISKTPREDGKFDVAYEAQLFVSWPRERAYPQSLDMILPARGDWEGLGEFFDAYGADEHSGKKCLAWEAHEVEQSLLWYYYRPLKNGCPLTDAALDDADLVARVPMTLELSAENTQGKSPEYGKVWEDGKLVVTAIFGKYESGATDDGDAGISAFQETYQDLLATFGPPTSTNLTDGQQPDATNDQVMLTFDTVSGPLDIQLFLVDGIREVDQDFVTKYNARTEISDFVSYSGHSGLGANIRAMARMGHFVQGQYQIFLVNGCDTMAYVDYAIRDAHLAANPGFGPNKYFDMITNAMPSYFHMNSTANLAIINGLIGKTKTYRQILAGFDVNQRAGVTGEEDNNWPDPF